MSVAATKIIKQGTALSDAKWRCIVVSGIANFIQLQTPTLLGQSRDLATFSLVHLSVAFW